MADNRDTRTGWTLYNRDGTIMASYEHRGYELTGPVFVARHAMDDRATEKGVVGMITLTNATTIRANPVGRGILARSTLRTPPCPDCARVRREIERLKADLRVVERVLAERDDD